jgi:hypothetical protein
VTVLPAVLRLAASPLAHSVGRAPNRTVSGKSGLPLVGGLAVGVWFGRVGWPDGRSV